MKRQLVKDVILLIGFFFPPIFPFTGLQWFFVLWEVVMVVCTKGGIPIYASLIANNKYM